MELCTVDSFVDATCFIVSDLLFPYLDCVLASNL